MLVYDWTSFGDIEVVVEDIERIDFERFDTQETQMRDWRFGKEWAWACARMKYTNDKQKIMSMFGVPRYDVPELTVDPYDAKKYREVWLNVRIKYFSNFMIFIVDFFVGSRDEVPVWL